jgi:hypothetical protein
VAVNQPAVIPSTTWPVHMRCHNNCAWYLCIYARLNTFNSRSTRLPLYVPFEDPVVCHVCRVRRHCCQTSRFGSGKIPADGWRNPVVPPCVCVDDRSRSNRCLRVRQTAKMRSTNCEGVSRCCFACPVHATNGRPAGPEDDNFGRCRSHDPILCHSAKIV